MSLRPLFCLFLSGHFRQVLLYSRYLFLGAVNHTYFKRFTFDNIASQRTANEVVIRPRADYLLGNISCIVKLIDNSEKIRTTAHVSLKIVTEMKIHFCLFDLILYAPSTIFQLNRDGLPGFNQY